MSRIYRLATLVVIGSLTVGWPPEAAAQTAVLPLKHAAKPTKATITPADLMTRLYIFADDSMMGRSAGTPGDVRGTSYIEREVRHMGLVPAGDNGTFFQAIPLFARSVNQQSQISADSIAVVVGRDLFPLHPGGIPRPLNGAQVIYAGNTTDTTTLVPPAQTVGKVVVLTGPSSGIARRYPGAVAFILLPTGGQASPNLRAFSLGASTQMRDPADTASRPLTIAVPATSIAAFLGVPLENARPGTLGRTIRGDIRYTEAALPARNVVAVLPGSDPKLRGQYVAIGAHSDHVGTRRQGPLDQDSVRTFNKIAERVYVARTKALPGFPGSGLTPEERATIRINADSLHAGRPAKLDSIFNGADDDGSGSVTLLELAEKFAAAKVKPKRSLLFVWHTAEESGLHGSEHFTDHPTVPRDSIVAQLNVDMIGRGRADDIPGGTNGGNGPGYLQLLGSRRLSTELGDVVESVNTTRKHNFKFDYTFDANGHPEQYYCRSDHYEYARYGIPIVFMSTGGHVDYHQLTDEPQYIDYEHLARVGNFLGDVAQHIANLDHRLVVDKTKPDPKAPCRQ